MEQLKAMQEQINNLQGQVKTLNGELVKAKTQAADAQKSAASAEKTATAAQEQTAKAPGTKTVTPANKSASDVKVTIGGFTEGAPAVSCVANNSSVSQLTAGAWWKFYKGQSGMMEVGAEDSYTRRNTFNDNITMLSFRYYPF